MELIYKSALVAEIERRINFFTEESGNSNSDIVIALFGLKSFLDTLEVKEVDFEKIWKEYFKYRGDVATVNVKHLAEHFFELGLRVSGLNTAADRGMTEEIIVNLKRVENDYRIDLTKEIGWLRNISACK